MPPKLIPNTQNRYFVLRAAELILDPVLNTEWREDRQVDYLIVPVKYLIVFLDFEDFKDGVTNFIGTSYMDAFADAEEADAYHRLATEIDKVDDLVRANWHCSWIVKSDLWQQVQTQAKQLLDLFQYNEQNYTVVSPSYPDGARYKWPRTENLDREIVEPQDGLDS